MNLDLLILIICGIAISLLGILVYFRNRKQLSNQRFALLSLSLVCWSTFNFLSDHATTHNLAYTRLTIFWGVASAYALINFMARFPKESPYSKGKTFKFQNILSVVLLILSLTPTIILSVSSEVGGDIQTGILYPIFIIYILLSLFSIFIIVKQQYRIADSSQTRQQVKFISLGIILYAFFASAVSVILPLILDSWSISRFGPAFTLLFVSLVAYTIGRHRLFDIRLIIARSIGYIATLATLVGIYVFIIFGLSSSLLGVNQPTLAQEVLYIVATLIFGFTLSPLKRFFDRQTNKLFYRDSYDSQVLFDELNKILVGNIDLKSLLRMCSVLFETTLKAEYCTFIINETEDSKQRVIGSGTETIDDEQITKLDIRHHVKQQIVISDELPESETKIKATLTDNNVSIMARLIPTGKGAKELGVLVLGNKRSGNPYNKQDLQVLEIIVNELVIAIQNSLRFEEIEAFTVTLQEKVNAATKNLRAANEKLKALDETKDEFISMASHQLRTPLTSVKGYVSMVVEGDAGKITKEQKDLLTQAFTSSQRMVYLIADLLNVSRLRTGKFVIENKPTQLAEVIEAEMAQLKETAKSKNQELTYTKPTKFPIMNLDETKIRQVIMNFTDNALHYTPNDGHIKVNLEDKGSSIEFTVVDDGLGVPKNEQHHLFGKFYRAGNAKKARPDGTGLGLFMAKKVIIAQGGAIIFKSEENKGSTFGFTMPKQGHLSSKS